MRLDTVFVVGTSQDVAPAAVRERLHMDLEEVYGALKPILTSRSALDEAVPLATCARLELYGVAPDPERAVAYLLRLLGRRTGMPPHSLRSHLYVLRGPAAVRHLLRVASGLDSFVHGETQVLGQVRDAICDPRARSTKGPVLHRLFETALATGKRVRTETHIGRGSASLAGAALRLVQRRIGSLDAVTALVMGAGHTGALVARLLSKAGIGRLIVANRTIEKAREVATPLAADAVSLQEVPAWLPHADLVVGAVTIDDFLVTTETLQSPVARPRRTPQYFLDLGHPRNFDPAIAGVDGANLLDLDHVFQRVEAARASRAAEAPTAERIVTDQVAAFERWARSRATVRVLRAFREHALDAAQLEADRLGSGLGEEEREQLRRVARSVARSLLHRPTIALRSADPSSEEGRSLIEAARALFGATVDDPSESDLPLGPRRVEPV